MKVLNVEQGSPEWVNARLGLPTSSQFHRIITPRTAKPSSAQLRYMADLLAERALNVSLDPAVNALMERGGSLEREAAAWYELTQGLAVSKVGLCLTDDGRIGCSPDRLVGDDGGLEIKCPSPGMHMMYLSGFDAVADDYRCQCQGAMWITGRRWWDTVSYHPDLPPALVRAERDEDFISALAEAVSGFSENLEREWLKLQEMLNVAA